ncbi:prolyl aminopeptidase [Halotalea alkalilenta]|uniref:Proline iminopeptidase n=1 Tax=Halotalea alkalilenta TaxID=376489 RepID=A0A172YAK0_9GAMM|nr:prolyl aminopeptidase [Halotalea alkalilenta]ANF56156.1 prolyl aminopeptidase [Halotalea alkalilenta]
MQSTPDVALDQQALYPLPGILNSGRLPVSSLHALYYEESGNPDGLPVLFLHGGPGAGFKPVQGRTIDPSRCRLVMFDQRGAGRSTPTASLEDNTTQALVEDIERLRRHLGIDRWLVAGGSWGSCLALAYGEAYPERCLGFRLHGIFLADQEGIDWWFQGSRAIFPDHWETFAAFVEPDERHDLLDAYYRRLTSDDLELQRAAAEQLRQFSGWTQTFLPDPEHVRQLLEGDAALALARCFTHYCRHRAFLRPGQLLDELDRIRAHPAEIVQARYDTVTPVISAWRLHRAWPEARMTLVTEANHLATQPPMATALRAATDRLLDRLIP